MELDLKISGQAIALLAQCHSSPQTEALSKEATEKLGTVPPLPPARMAMNSVGPGESISPPVHCPRRGSQGQSMEGVPCLSPRLRIGLSWLGLCTLVAIQAPQELRTVLPSLSAAAPCPAPALCSATFLRTSPPPSPHPYPEG